MQKINISSETAVPEKLWHGSFYETFAENLLRWYDANRRELPWRECRNAYYTWVSEIMLQQTRVAAVIPYFLRFTGELPDVKSLAECQPDRLMKLWEGLGYYSRVRNMQKAAQRIMSEYEGKIPRDYEKILLLEGIGPYTAGAIASIAFGERVPAIDGNVLRIMARILGIYVPVSDTGFRNEIHRVLSDIIPADRPGDFNQAMMDLGATVCVPKGTPACENCPLRAGCYACIRRETDTLPVKAPKKGRRIVPLTVLVIQDGKNTAIRKRKEKGLLSGMYEFPNVPGTLNEQEALQNVKDEGLDPLKIEKIEDSFHVFTHLEWRMTAYRIRVAESDRKDPEGDLIFVSRDESRQKYAIPSAFAAYLRYIQDPF